MVSRARKKQALAGVALATALLVLGEPGFTNILYQFYKPVRSHDMTSYSALESVVIEFTESHAFRKNFHKFLLERSGDTVDPLTVLVEYLHSERAESAYQIYWNDADDLLGTPEDMETMSVDRRVAGYDEVVFDWSAWDCFPKYDFTFPSKATLDQLCKAQPWYSQTTVNGDRDSTS